MSNSIRKPFSPYIGEIVAQFLLNPEITMQVESEGEMIDVDASPSRDRSLIVDDCYACDDAILNVYVSDEYVGAVHLVPYFADHKDDVVADYNCNEVIENVLNPLLNGE